jgi:hypothetical protein
VRKFQILLDRSKASAPFSSFIHSSFSFIHFCVALGWLARVRRIYTEPTTLSLGTECRKSLCRPVAEWLRCAIVDSYPTGRGFDSRCRHSDLITSRLCSVHFFFFFFFFLSSRSRNPQKITSLGIRPTDPELKVAHRWTDRQESETMTLRSPYLMLY